MEGCRSPAGGRGSAGCGSTGAPGRHRRGVQGPALRPRARPALTWKRSRFPGGAEKPRVRVYCAAAAGAQRRAPAPGQTGAAPETPGLGEQRAKGSAGAAAAEGLRGSREWGGGLQAEPFAVVPPKAFAGPWPLQGMVLAKGCCRGLCQHQGRGVLLTGWLIAVSIPCRACSCPGEAAACVWILP